jgi:hypothetical protein
MGKGGNMSLIDCPECKNQISDKAFSCPHCGFPLSEQRIMSNSGYAEESSDNIDIGKILDDGYMINLLMEGRKIEAIKRCREITGWGLKEAKEAVERMALLRNIPLKKEKACFIATACYGTPLANEVEILRNYRDDVLMKSLWGRCFVKAYYLISPSIAKIIENSAPLRKLIARYLLTPLVKSVGSRNP